MLCILGFRYIYINSDSQTFIFDLSEAEKIMIASVPKNKGIKASEVDNVLEILSLQNTYGLNKEADRIMMKKIIIFLKKNNKSITISHSKWYKCAYAIANTFSYEIGLKYFLSLSELDGPSYDEYKSRERIKYCYLNKKDEGGVHFATIITFAKEVGFVTNRKSDKVL